MAFSFPPFGIPKTGDFHSVLFKIKSVLPEGPYTESVKSGIDDYAPIVGRLAFAALRLMDLSPSTYRYSAAVSLAAGGYDLFRGSYNDGAVSVGRAIASLMGLGSYLVVADIAVTYMQEFRK